MNLRSGLAHLLLFSLSTSVAHATIYKTDDRKNIWEINDPARVALAEASVAIFEAKDIQSNAATGLSKFFLTRSGSFDELCEGEAFENQAMGAVCSGTLIAPDQILTAAHCIRDIGQCQDRKFVFDFKEAEDRKAPFYFSTNNVYSCKKILGISPPTGESDWAVVQLDRPAHGRTPMKLAKNLPASNGGEIWMMGYPSGLPLKMTVGGQILSNHPQDPYFLTDLDGFHGNSGSPVISNSTLEVIGILSSGFKQDYLRTKTGCRKVFRCGDHDCAGERAIKITELPAVYRGP